MELFDSIKGAMQWDFNYLILPSPTIQIFGDKTNVKENYFTR